jgi:hypothetical protein
MLDTSLGFMRLHAKLLFYGSLKMPVAWRTAFIEMKEATDFFDARYFLGWRNKAF